jgi:hypothetical protein
MFLKAEKWSIGAAMKGKLGFINATVLFPKMFAVLKSTCSKLIFHEFEVRVSIQCRAVPVKKFVFTSPKRICEGLLEELSICVNTLNIFLSIRPSYFI